MKNNHYKKQVLRLLSLVILFWGIHAEVFAQSEKIALDIKDVPIRKFFDKIEEQSNYRFTYRDMSINDEKHITYSTSGESIETLLQKTLTPLGLQFQISKKDILITRKTSVQQEDKENDFSGTVTDDKGEFIIGASIAVKGTGIGTITDLAGKFHIKASAGSTITVSYIGYIAQEVKLGENTDLQIVIREDSKSLNEVVVIGYGSLKKRDVTGAVASVKSNELDLTIASNFQQALQGKAAGVEVIQSTGQPGAGVSVKIRSNPSSANAGVLYVIDGVPVNDNAGTPSSAKYGTTGIDQSALNFINPNDIETISFLKDASAASIYGARAGAGVVLITTKRGKSDIPKVQYSGNYSIQKVDKIYDLLGTKDYMTQRNLIKQEVYMKDNRIAPYYGTTDISSVAPFVPFFTQSEIDNAEIQPNAMDAILQTGHTQQHNLSVSGGSGKTHYFTSVNYFEQDGVVIKTGYKRYSGRVNVDQELSKQLKIGVNLIATNHLSDNTVTGGKTESSGIITSAIYHPANIPLQDDEGNYPINPNWANSPNPLSFMTVTDFTKGLRLLTNAFVEWEIINGLKAKGNFSYDQSTNKRSSYYPRTFLTGQQVSGLAAIDERQSDTKLLEYTLNYAKQIGNKSALNALAGYSYQLSNWEGVGAGNQTFVSDAISYYNLGSGEAAKPSVNSYKSQETWASYFFRATYQYDDKYFLQLSLRRDGSSKFAKNKKWGTFPSVSASWIVSDEHFLKNIHQISNLKLRAGYGETGNCNFSGTAFERYSLGSSPIFNQNSVSTGMYLTRAANPNLTWETAGEINAGLDLGLFANRIDLSLDVYDKTIRNLIAWMPYPGDFIVSGVNGNAGKTKSTGFEIAVRSRNLISSDNRGFTWSTALTFSHYFNYWIERSPEAMRTLAKYVAATGRDALFNGWYGYQSDGLFTGNYGTAPSTMPNMLPGGIIIRDIHGYDEQGNLTASDSKITAADQTLLGNWDPEFNFGMSNTFTFRNFDFTVFLSGIKQIGRDPYSGYSNNIYPIGNIQANMLSFGWNETQQIKDRWTFGNPNGTRPTGVSDGPYQDFYNNSDYWLVDASFLRIKTINLGYSLPDNVMAKLKGISSVRIFADIQNAFTFTKFPILDPELNSSNYYPFNRSMTFGIDVSF